VPGHLGLELVEIGGGSAVMRCELQGFIRLPTDACTAGSIISLADTASGYGCVGNMPEGTSGFTTIG
jgi:acyl-coenzyme A thioesterase PaaI-like protein